MRKGTTGVALAALVGVGLGFAAIALPTLAASWSMVALTVLLLPFLLMLVRDVERAIIVVILLETSIPLDVFLGFRVDAADMAALPGLPISLTTLLLAALYGTWALRRLGRLAPSDPDLVRAVAPLAVFVIVVASSWFGAVDVQLAAFEVGLLVQMLLLFGYLVHAIRTPADLHFYVNVLVAVVFLQALIMSGLVVVGRSVEFGPFLARIDAGTRTRVAGTVGSPNAAGAFLTLMLLPTLAAWRAATTPFVRTVASVAFLLGVTMLVFTLSRGAWLGFSVGVLLFLVVGLRRGWLPPAFVATIVAIGAVVAAALAGVIAARLFGSDVSPIGDRTALMRLAIAMFLDHPLRGVGANGFSAALPDYLTPSFAGSWISTVHNKYLIVASETGALGLVAFLGFIGVTVRRAWRAVANLPPRQGILALGLGAAFIGVLVHMFFDLFHGRSDTQVLIVIAALITAAWRLTIRPRIPAANAAAEVPQ